MKISNIPLPHFFFGMLFFFVIYGCHDTSNEDLSDQHLAQTINEENLDRTTTGTREMIQRVNEAVSKIDPSKVPYILNEDKARILKSKIDQEKGLNKFTLIINYGTELLRCGKHDQAIGILSNTLSQIESLKLKNVERNVYEIKKRLAIAYMRKGEQENCIANHNNESCIIPFSIKAQHSLKEGSQKTIKILQELLAINPNDLECLYLLNIANMTLGQYPSEVPEKYQLPDEYFASSTDFPAFKDVDGALGVAENQNAGGTCVDDFNNDGYLDIIASSWGGYDQIKYFENDKHGAFIDKTIAAGLLGVTGGLNLKHTDYNNDGFLDFIILRGAWLGEYGKIPNSLMKNNGDGTFTDVTIEAGLYSLHPTQTAVWADFDLNGWVDLFIANESNADCKSNCELYLNTNGNFKEVSAKVGFDQLGYFKGVACGDINNDGYLDLYLSNYMGKNLLYLNSTHGEKLSFKDITTQAKVALPNRSFSTWMFDYDNDGYDDIFVSGYSEKGKSPASLMVANIKYDYHKNRPAFYHNNGDNTFTETSLEVGIDEPITTMGCNFGDLNNDGFLDFYLATGDPSFFSIVPNRVYLNKSGEKFEDITYSAGFGSIQKGHAIGFGDFDKDGDQDIYAVLGGAYDGDIFGNVLYDNPIGNKNNWTTILLEGNRANRFAVGAKIILTIEEYGTIRKIYHLVGIDASFGGNSIQAEMGLGKAQIIKKIEIYWPNRNRSKTILKNIAINQTIKIWEKNDRVEILDITPTPFKKNSFSHHHHRGG